MKLVSVAGGQEIGMSVRKETKGQHQQVARTLRAASAFVDGTDEPISDEEAQIIEEARQDLPRANKAGLMALARRLAKPAR